MSKENKKAFPELVAVDGILMSRGGLTKREYFAAMAMQGLCVPCIPGHENANDNSESIGKAMMAVRLADALLKELAKEQE